MCARNSPSATLRDSIHRSRPRPDEEPLPRRRRLEFLADLDLAGEAVERVCGRRDSGFRRVNLEILGNTDPFLHAHVWPRYEWEPPELLRRAVWLYPPDRWSDPTTALGPQHHDLRRSITAHLERGEPGNVAQPAAG